LNVGVTQVTVTFTKPQRVPPAPVRLSVHAEGRRKSWAGTFPVFWSVTAVPGVFEPLLWSVPPPYLLMVPQVVHRPLAGAEQVVPFSVRPTDPVCTALLSLVIVPTTTLTVCVTVLLRDGAKRLSPL
jgi:hypothetical protein